MKTDKLAIEFLKLLRAEPWYEQACERNRAETDPNICHTHDFCDANMLMLKAYCDVYQVSEECFAHDDWTDRMNAAWALAKQAMVGIITIEQQDRLEDLETEILGLECDVSATVKRDDFAKAMGEIQDWHSENDDELAILKELEKCAS